MSAVGSKRQFAYSRYRPFPVVDSGYSPSDHISTISYYSARMFAVLITPRQVAASVLIKAASADGEPVVVSMP